MRKARWARGPCAAGHEGTDCVGLKSRGCVAVMGNGLAPRRRPGTVRCRGRRGLGRDALGVRWEEDPEDVNLCAMWVEAESVKLV